MDSKNNNHNSNFLSKQSKDEESYRYDNFGNIIADSIDDLIYDKHLRIKNKKSPGGSIKLYDKKSYISNSSSYSISKKEEDESEENIKNQFKLKYSDNKSHNLIRTINNNNKYSNASNGSDKESKKDKPINTNKNNTDSYSNTNKNNINSYHNTNKNNTDSSLNTNKNNINSYHKSNKNNTDSSLNTNKNNFNSYHNLNKNNSKSFLNTNKRNSNSYHNTNKNNADSYHNENKNNISFSQNKDNDSNMQNDLKNKNNSTNKDENGITNDKTLKSINTNKDNNLININTLDNNNDSKRLQKIGKLTNSKEENDNEELSKEKKENKNDTFVYFEQENENHGNKKLKKITFFIEKEYDNNKENKKSKKYNKSMNISLHNENFKINKSFRLMDSKSLVLKLRLNSNNTSVESFDIEKDENKKENKKLKNKYALENQISPITNFNKLGITTKKTVKNKCYFCTKQNITIHQYSFKKSEFPINIINKLNKKTNKIFTKISINKNKHSSAPKTSLRNITKSLSKIKLNKNILSQKKTIKQNNLKKFKLSSNYNISNKTSIKTPNLKRKFIIKSRLSSNKNNNIPLLSINNTNGDIFNINLESEKDNIYGNENNEHYHNDENDENYQNDENDKNYQNDENDKNYQNDENDANYQKYQNFDNYENVFYHHHLKKYRKHWGNEKNCPLCREMAEKSKLNEYKIFGISNSIKLKKFKFKHINNMKYKTIFDKNLFRNEEMNKLKKTNNRSKKNIFNRNYLFKEYPINSNYFKNKINIRNSLPSLNYFSNNKNNMEKRKNLIDYFNCNDSKLLDSYSDLIDIEFPAINSYFHKNNNQ